jgi:SdrD B-like protein
MVSRISAMAVVAAVCGAAMAAGAVSAGADPIGGGAPDLRVSARFDKVAYQSGDAASVTYKFVNTGSVDARKVALYAGGNGDPWELAVTDWGGIGFGDEGVLVPAGGTVNVVLRGVVPARSADMGKVGIAYGFIAENGDSDQEDNSGVARASVPGAVGARDNLVYHDADGDHRVEPGEGLAGVKITVVGLYDIELITSLYTDEDGKARFTGLPVGEYEVRLTLPDGYWPVHGNTVTRGQVRGHEVSSMSFAVEPID